MPAAKKATSTTAKAKAKATAGATRTATDRRAAGGAEPKPAAAPPSHPTPSDKWLAKQQHALYSARAERLEDAEALKAEADQMALDAEPGDTQFDDESGEGSTAAVDRERDLALSAQARAEVAEIDVALDKIDEGRYGICDRCGKAIPKARLEVIPWAAMCVNCKSGGLSARR